MEKQNLKYESGDQESSNKSQKIIVQVYLYLFSEIRLWQILIIVTTV